MSTPSVIFTTDANPGWVFQNIADKVSTELAEFYQFAVMPFTMARKEECDILVCLWWQSTLRTKANVKARAIISCVYDALSWNIDSPSQHQFRLTLRNSTAVGACNKRILSKIHDTFGVDVPDRAFLIEDGVDTQLFRALPMPPAFTVGWTGNSSRMTPGGPTDHKGLGIIKEACAKAGVALKVLDAVDGNAWPHEDMPQFYAQVSCVACGSYTEGTPNPLLEGLSCGRPVVTTNVGLAPDIIKPAVNGYIVERDAEDMAQAFRTLADKSTADLTAMGAAGRQSVLSGWTWKAKAAEWKKILVASLAPRFSTRPVADASAVKVYLPPPSTAPATEAAKPQPAIAATAPAPTPVITTHSKRLITEPWQNSDPDPRGRPRALLISDVQGWAFDVNMHDLAEYLEAKYVFEHWYVMDYLTKGTLPDMDRFDVVFCVYHRWSIMEHLPMSRCVGSLRSRWFRPEEPGAASADDIALVNSFRAFHVVTKENYLELKGVCPNAVYLTNPVSMQRFPTMTPVRDGVVFSWNGNAKHRSGSMDVKGFNTIIRPACEAAGVRLEYAEYNTKRLPPASMPEFYQRSNVAICMSEYEGSSNSTSEAMAAGLVLITTDVGHHREMAEAQMAEWSDTGIIFVERDIGSLLEAISMVQKLPGERLRRMGELNRMEIARRWSWDVWAPEYDKFLKKGLPSSDADK